MTAPSLPENIIRVRGLCKSYGETRALDGVGFAVRAGEIFGFLGPNGAGKTTTINILCGLLRRDAGEVAVCGLHIDRNPVAVKEKIGVVPEESNLYPELACRRNLEYLGELYGLSRARRKARADALLDTFDLAGKADAPFRTLSRGLKRRLTVAAALVHSPQVLFLDEPTAGLDVPSARALRSLIRAINRDGVTVFLTTHNLAEAEALCDRILILAEGRAVAEGTAREIQERVGKAETLSVVFSRDVGSEALLQACGAVQAAARADGKWLLTVRHTHEAVAQLAPFAERQGVRILEISSAAASLEDAFVTILKEGAAETETRQ